MPFFVALQKIKGRRRERTDKKGDNSAKKREKGAKIHPTAPASLENQRKQAKNTKKISQKAERRQRKRKKEHEFAEISPVFSPVFSFFRKKSRKSIAYPWKAGVDSKKRGKTPQKSQILTPPEEKAAKRRGGERKKAGNARPKKKKRPKRRENRRTKAQKMPSPPKKIKKSLETPAFSPILTDFSVSFRTFAVFSPLLRLVLTYFCAVFALSTAVFSSFLLYSAIPFRFFHGFFTVFGSFFPPFSRFSPFKAPPLVLDFSAFGFLFFGFLSTFSLFFCRFCPPQSRIHLKNPLFYPFLCFLFLFLRLYDRLSSRFLLFPCFSLWLSAFAEEKSKIRRFRLSNNKKSCEQRKRRRRKANTGSAGRKKRRQKGKSALRAGTISQKISVFLPKNLTKRAFKQQ